MFLRVLHISVVAALLFQQCQFAVVCLLFKIEQPYLSKNVCEKRNDPKSMCKAHCQLLNLVRHHDKQQQQNKVPMKEEAKAEFIVLSQRPILISVFLSASNLFRQIWGAGYLFPGHANILLQPPEEDI